jgi:hypothetical protein
MDPKEFAESYRKISQPLAAIAAQIVGGEDDLARQVAEGLDHENLLTMVLIVIRMYAFGAVDALEKSSGASPEEAREHALAMFRMSAAFGSLDT